jgi:hypothetical protein
MYHCFFKSLAISFKIYIVLNNKQKHIFMAVDKTDVETLIAKAKGVLNEGDPSYELLLSYIKRAEDMLPDIKGNLTSAQKEVYNVLEVAVGP